MNLDSFSHATNELSSVGVKHIQLIGGEPLILNKKLKKMISPAVGLFERVSIYTNATLIDSDWARFFSNKKVHVNITVYSYSAKEHDKVTQRSGSHKKTNRAIQYLKDFGANYSVTCVRMNGVQLGSKQTDLYDLNTRHDIVRNCGRADLKLLNRELLQEKIITKKRFSKSLNPTLSSLLVSGHNCFSQKIYIAHDLRVYPCPMERGTEYGSLKYNQLNQIIERSVPINKNTIKVCKDCEYRYACFDCRADRLKNDIFAKPWYCSYDPYRANWKPIDDFMHSLEQKHLN
jgi:radical SAM protein with 4Fe4S-binding SPASM domain